LARIVQALGNPIASQHRLSSPTDGQTESCQQVFGNIFVVFFIQQKNQWAQWLPLVEWWYNTSYHTATHMTPFEVVYGKNPSSFLSYMPGVSKVQEVDKNLTV
jgi:hypothetical protein